MIQAALHLLLFAQAAAAPSQAATAAPSISETTTAERVVYDFSRLQAFDDERLPLALIAAVAIGLVAVVWQFYRRDAIELSRATRLA